MSQNACALGVRRPAPRRPRRKAKRPQDERAEARRGRGAQPQHDELLALLAQPDIYADQAGFDAAMGEYGAVKASLAALEREWLELTEVIESIDAKQAPPGGPLSPPPSRGLGKRRQRTCAPSRATLA